MKRMRLSTLMLLIVIAALITALVVQDRLAARREAELKGKLDSRAQVIERIMPLVKQLQSQQSDVGKPGVKEGDTK
ncbi:MAG: hypothetical protein ACLQIB_35120 [Isosphaeraceae bacterium]